MTDASTSGPVTRPEARQGSDASGGSGQRLLRSSVIVAAGTGLSRITGLLRVAALAFALGRTTAAAVAYNYANTAPNQIYELALGGVLTSVLVPLFVDDLRREDEEAGWRSIASIFTVGLAVAAGASILLTVFAPVFIEIAGPSLSGDERDFAVDFLRFFGPQVFFYALNALSSGLLQAQRRFAVPAFAPVLNNLLVIGTFLVFGLRVDAAGVAALSAGDLAFLAVGTTAGVAVMALATTAPLAPRAWLLRPNFHWRTPVIRKLLTLSGWTVAYVATNQVALIAMQRIMSVDGPGYAAWNFAFMFFQLPNGIIAVSIMTALLPSLAERYSSSDAKGFATRLSGGMRLVTFLMLPATIGYLFLAEPIIEVTLQWGLFDRSDTEVVADLLRWMSLGLLPFSLLLVQLRAFYATQDTKTPFKINLLARAVGIALYAPAYALLDVNGLALANAVSFTIGALLSSRVINRRIARFGAHAGLGLTWRIPAAATAMTLALWLVTSFFSTDPGNVAAITELLLAVLVGSVVYLGVAYLFGVPEMADLARFVRRRDTAGPENPPGPEEPGGDGSTRSGTDPEDTPIDGTSER